MTRLKWTAAIIAAGFFFSIYALTQSVTPAGGNQSSAPAQLKVITGVKRHPSLTIEQFRAKWREHGELVQAHPVTRRYLKKYVQNYVAASAYENGEPPFDGFVEQWFENAQEYARFRADPEYTGPLRGKIAEFTDVTKRAMYVVEEVVVLGR